MEINAQLSQKGAVFHLCLLAVWYFFPYPRFALFFPPWSTKGHDSGPNLSIVVAPSPRVQRGESLIWIHIIIPLCSLIVSLRICMRLLL